MADETIISNALDPDYAASIVRAERQKPLPTQHSNRMNCFNPDYITKMLEECREEDNKEKGSKVLRSLTQTTFPFETI